MKASNVFVSCVLLLIKYQLVLAMDDSKLVRTLEENPNIVGPWMKQLMRPTYGATGRLAKIDVPCSLCESIGGSLLDDLTEGIPVEEVIEGVVTICTTFGGVEEVCRGLIRANLPTVAWVAANSPSANLTRICVEVVGATCDDYVADGNLWNVELPDVPKPPVGLPEIPEDVPRLKILHIADIHLDPLYEEGSESLCDYIICCQSMSGPAVNEPAGLFGSYNPCDTPQIALEDAFQHIVETHPDIDLVFFTGDLPPHDLWRQTVDGNNEIIDQGMATIRKYFGNITVLNLIGNHETHPLNVFSFVELDAPEELRTDYIYDVAWKHWEHWMPADQQDNVLKGGFYSVSPHEGLRVIGIDNIYGYVNNWFAWMDIPDPNGQLTWLANELQLAEDNSESVYILGHIPPGYYDLTPVWSHNFNRIVNRYQNIIKGQFYGHTHWDEFNVFFNEDGQPSNVAFITPSMTTYEYLNYGYRVFHVDGSRGADSTWTVLDHETWIYDLDVANEDRQTLWYKAYSMKEEYGVTDLSPASYATLAESFRTDDAAFLQYFQNFWKNSALLPECNNECRASYICGALTSDTSDKSHC